LARSLQVQMMKSNGEIIYFNNPKLMALPSANTFAVSGHPEIRSKLTVIHCRLSFIIIIILLQQNSDTPH